VLRRAGRRITTDTALPLGTPLAGGSLADRLCWQGLVIAPEISINPAMHCPQVPQIRRKTGPAWQSVNRKARISSLHRALPHLR